MKIISVFVMKLALHLNHHTMKCCVAIFIAKSDYFLELKTFALFFSFSFFISETGPQKLACPCSQFLYRGSVFLITKGGDPPKLKHDTSTAVLSFTLLKPQTILDFQQQQKKDILIRFLALGHHQSEMLT